jgi:hypothetical protein
VCKLFGLFKKKKYSGSFKQLINDENYTLTKCKKSYDELLYSLSIHDMGQVIQATKDIKDDLFKLRELIKLSESMMSERNLE